MFFTENKVDKVTKMAVMALYSKRFNVARYENGNKFHGFMTYVSRHDNGYTVKIFGDTNLLAHTITTHDKNIYVDGRLYEDIVREDLSEKEELRSAVIEPIIKKIADRLQDALCELDEKNSTKIANLFEYCAAPRQTAIGTSYSYNRGSLVRLLTDNLRRYASRCDEGNGIHTLKQVERMIDEKKM